MEAWPARGFEVPTGSNLMQHALRQWMAAPGVQSRVGNRIVRKTLKVRSQRFDALKLPHVDEAVGARRKVVDVGCAQVNGHRACRRETLQTSQSVDQTTCAHKVY